MWSTLARSVNFQTQKYAGLNVQVDGLFIDLVERLPAQPHGLDLLVALVEEDDVGALDEVDGDSPSLLRLEVHDDRLLAGVALGLEKSLHVPGLAKRNRNKIHQAF